MVSIIMVHKFINIMVTIIMANFSVATQVSITVVMTPALVQTPVLQIRRSCQPASISVCFAW